MHWQTIWVTVRVYSRSTRAEAWPGWWIFFSHPTCLKSSPTLLNASPGLLRAVSQERGAGRDNKFLFGFTNTTCSCMFSFFMLHVHWSVSSVCIAENRKLLHEQHVEKVLVEYLSVEDNGVKMSTCQAVAAMSLHLDSKGRFQELGRLDMHITTISSTCWPRWNINEFD